MTIPAGTRLGPYEILSPLGAGGMGEVYRARDTRLGREVAVKVLPASVSADPDRLRRFEKEARSASSLNHPNVVTVYDIGQADGTSYIAMELVDGRTLRQLLAEGALPTKRLLGIAAQMADGLARAHGAGIVHRDLKPENVMVRKDGFVKILDFGLAKLTQAGPSETEQTHTPTLTAGTEAGVVMGTVGYMSPEQALGKALDFRSDQFAFGSIVYEMVTGRGAFQRRSAPETMAAIIREEPEPIASAAPATPTPLCWFVERCLAKDPEERYASTRDLARDLARLRDGLSQGAVSGGATVTEPAGSRSGRWLVWAAGGRGAAAAIVAAAMWRRVEEPPTFRALTFRRGSMGGARFGPDGQTVIYAAAWQGKPIQLYSTRSDSTESTALPLPSADVLAVSAAGKMAIRMDRDTGPVVAEVPLAGGVPRELFEGDLQSDYSPSGDRMVIARRGKLEYPVGKVLYDAGADKEVRGPRFSPDGRWIAFIEQSGNRAAIGVVDLAGKKRTLSDGWETTTSLAWHPVTGEVWFSAREFASFGVVNLHAVSLSGRHRVVARGPLLLLIQDIARDGRVLLRADDWTETTKGLAPGAARESDLTWLDDSLVADLSSDGQTLLFTEGGIAEGANEAVYLRKTDGSPAVRLGEGVAQALSPDGKWAITKRGEGLVLLPTGAGEPRPIATSGLEVDRAGWFPDGENIFYAAASRGQLMRIYEQDVAGGAPRPITPEGFFGRALSPDGKLVAARNLKDRGVFLFPVEGGEPRPLPGIVSADRINRFDAAGTGIFLSSSDNPLRITRYDIASGRREPWGEIAVADSAGFVQFNDIVLTPDGKSYAYTFVRMLSRLYVVQGLK
jgi:predicted Ser/Thr protein kinase